MAATASTPPALPGKIQFTYAIGQLGWSTLVNVIGLQLLFFYVPTSDANLPIFITQATFLVVLNAIALIAASGRLFDAITDPIIASWSDRSQRLDGRRIPFMRWGALPAVIFYILMFLPPVARESGWNIVWLVVTQFLFYLALTAYVTPYFALLSELGKNPTERLNLSTWISITYALGIIVAAQTPSIATALEGSGLSKVGSFQASVIIAGVFALVCMYVPVFTIDERRYVHSSPSSEPLLPALRHTLRNRHFIFYVVADFSYFLSLTLIQTGLLYYISVLLGLAADLVGGLLLITFVISFLFYPVVNLLARRVGKKVLVVGAFIGMSLIFALVYFLGRLPFEATTQAYLLMVVYAIPVAFLGILPNAILSDIAEHDSLLTGQPKEGMYFAARTLLQKFGQTLGLFIFAILTIWGKDPGDDLGIRLSGVVGFVFCLLAGIIFSRYNERELLSEIEQAHKR